jgi:hypothetical protein
VKGREAWLQVTGCKLQVNLRAESYLQLSTFNLQLPLRHRTNSNAYPFKYSVSGIIGITG